MQKTWKSWVLAAAVLGAVSGAAVGQIAPTGGAIVPPGGQVVAPPTPATPANTPSTAPTATMPSAQDVLQGLLTNKPAADGGHPEPTIEPVVPLGPEPGMDGLLREGQQIELRTGHLKKDASGAIVFAFDAKEKPVYPDMGVVPSKRLAAMENFAGFADGGEGNDQPFQITAEVTQYRKKNYLYIKPSGVPVPAPAKPVAQVNVGLANPVAPGAPALPAPMPQGNVISNRVGRLVKDVKTGAELIAFDSDGKLMADPPMGVIPCQYLEMIEDATDHGLKPLKFRLSGEVTTYRGKNYLYLKNVVVVRDLNQGIGSGSNPVTPGAQP